MQSSEKRPVRIVTFENLIAEKGIPYCADHLRRRVRDGTFPAPIPLGGKRIGWLECELDDWLMQCADEREKIVLPTVDDMPSADDACEGAHRAVLPSEISRKLHAVNTAILRPKAPGGNLGGRHDRKSLKKNGCRRMHRSRAKK
jgi:prophage regulatory protein